MHFAANERLRPSHPCRPRHSDCPFPGAGLSWKYFIVYVIIMTTVELKLNLPDELAQRVRDAGLLTPQALERLLNDALRRKQVADSLLSIADRVAAAGIPPMSMEEINAEVKAARVERKQRAGGH